MNSTNARPSVRCSRSRDFARHRVAEFRRLRRRHLPRQVEDRLLGEIELRRHAQAVGVVARRGGPSRSRTSPPTVSVAEVRTVARMRSNSISLMIVRHVDRRRAQEHAAVARLEEVDERRDPTPRAGTSGGRAARRRAAPASRHPRWPARRLRRCRPACVIDVARGRRAPRSSPGRRRATSPNQSGPMRSRSSKPPRA